MPLQFETLPGKERAGKISTRIFSVAALILLVGVILTVKLAPDVDFIASRIVPTVLFGAVGLGGLVNVGFNLWLYRYGWLGPKRVTKQQEPIRYWLLFALFTLLSLAALAVAILIGTGKLVKHPPNHPVPQASLGTVFSLPSDSFPAKQIVEATWAGAFSFS